MSFAQTKWTLPPELQKRVEEENLDPELCEAISAHVESMLARMVVRALKGEAQYHGHWRKIPLNEFSSWIGEEEDDIHVYRAMQAWHERQQSERNDHSPGSAGVPGEVREQDEAPSHPPAAG